MRTMTLDAESLVRFARQDISRNLEMYVAVSKVREESE